MSSGNGSGGLMNEYRELSEDKEVVVGQSVATGDDAVVGIRYITVFLARVEMCIVVGLAE